ncbi:hypothetical protein JKP88DRAFT_315336 [Tribonema minus]|uniref:Cyclin-like domain-containing protein n=1 Tax=Tribonema minus TaxID=303371 RepID=A0A836CF67_9STRA|nr:hypothetical protein JKP88DRAFT_315336 [Tribonema minus]
MQPCCRMPPPLHCKERSSRMPSSDATWSLSSDSTQSSKGDYSFRSNPGASRDTDHGQLTPPPPSTPQSQERQAASRPVCTAKFSQLRRWETNSSVPLDFLSRHPYLEAGIRSAIVGWILQAQQALGLRPETLFLATSLIDRGLGATPRSAALTKDRYLLLAIAALHVAAKYEEVRPPGLRRLLATAGDRCGPAEALSAELALLHTVGFRVGAPTVLTFLSCCLGILDPKPCAQVATLCGNVAERLLLETEAVAMHLPSELACAAVAAACRAIDMDTYATTWQWQLRAWGGEAAVSPPPRACALVQRLLWHAARGGPLLPQPQQKRVLPLPAPPQPQPQLRYAVTSCYRSSAVNGAAAGHWWAHGGAGGSGGGGHERFCGGGGSGVGAVVSLPQTCAYASEPTALMMPLVLPQQPAVLLVPPLHAYGCPVASYRYVFSTLHT